MGDKAENGFLAPPQTRKELKALFNRVVRKIAAMSAEERVDTMIRAGIYTKNRKLTRHYRG